LASIALKKVKLAYRSNHKLAFISSYLIVNFFLFLKHHYDMALFIYICSFLIMQLVNFCCVLY